MFKNYFYLTRSVKELNSELTNTTIKEIFTQEKHKLYIHIPNEEYSNRHLIISANPGLPYLTTKNDQKKAKKNVISFFGDFLPSEINLVEIAKSDRVIKFSLDQSKLYFLIRGKRTNCVMMDEKQSIHSFKKMEKPEVELLKTELLNLKYTNEFTLPQFNELKKDSLEYESVKKAFPRLSKEIYFEAKTRMKSETISELKIQLQKVIEEIYFQDIAVFHDYEKNKMVFAPFSFKSLSIPVDLEFSKTYTDSVNKYISTRYRSERNGALSKKIENFIDRELLRLSKKLNNLKNRIDEGSKQEDYNLYGNLLLSNIDLLYKGMKVITLEDYLTNETIKINLNEMKSPRENVDNYFEKSRDEKINFEKSKELYNKTRIQYEKFIKIKDQLISAKSIDDLISLQKELKIKDTKTSSKKLELKIRYRHYVIDGKYHVYVGRDNKSNDLLTIKFAKQNDYWFHARGLPGSHVVLRVENPKEGIPKNILKNAASITAFYSKSKTAKLAPVIYTFAKFVHKKKGLDPGQVFVSKEKVLLVKPEVPQNAELLSDDES